jgi:hypothetical protein
MVCFNLRTFGNGGGTAAGDEALFVRGVEARISLEVNAVCPNGDS